MKPPTTALSDLSKQQKADELLRCIEEHRVFAEKLKGRMTTAELILDRALRPYGFESQVPLGPWVADFYHREFGIVVEVDGEIHDTHRRSCLDDEKERDLSRVGIVVLRFRNEEVTSDLGRILQWVRDARSPRFPARRIHIFAPERADLKLARIFAERRGFTWETIHIIAKRRSKARGRDRAREKQRLRDSILAGPELSEAEMAWHLYC